MSKPVVLNDSTEETHYYVRHIELENAAPVLIAHRTYSHGGKEFLPDSAQARWSHGDAIREIIVSGYVLKKDRTTGQQRTDVRYLTPAHGDWQSNSRWRIDPDAPAWLLDLFGIEIPEGAAE